MIKLLKKRQKLFNKRYGTRFADFLLQIKVLISE